MKLMTVLMLTALPLFCYAEWRTQTIAHKLSECLSLLGGSGCSNIEYVIEKTIDPKESINGFIQDLEEYITGGVTEMALRKFKQCFLDQNKQTLSDVGVLMKTIFNSQQCAAY